MIFPLIWLLHTLICHKVFYVLYQSYKGFPIASNISVKKSTRVDRFGDHLSTGTKCDGDHLSMGTNCLGDLMSLGTKWTGTICLLGPNVSGNQMSSGPNVSQPKWQFGCNLWTICPTDFCLTSFEMANNFKFTKIQPRNKKNIFLFTYIHWKMQKCAFLLKSGSIYLMLGRIVA